MGWLGAEVGLDEEGWGKGCPGGPEWTGQDPCKERWAVLSGWRGGSVLRLPRKAVSRRLWPHQLKLPVLSRRVEGFLELPGGHWKLGAVSWGIMGREKLVVTLLPSPLSLRAQRSLLTRCHCRCDLERVPWPSGLVSTNAGSRWPPLRGGSAR